MLVESDSGDGELNYYIIVSDHTLRRGALVACDCLATRMDNGTFEHENKQAFTIYNAEHEKERKIWEIGSQRKFAFRKALVEFSKNTTIHGLKYISESNSLLFRR